MISMANHNMHNHYDLAVYQDSADYLVIADENDVID